MLPKSEVERMSVITRDVDEWSVTGTSGANTAKTITKAAQENLCHRVTGFSVVLRAAAATGDVKIELKDGSSLKWTEYIGDAAARGTRVAVTFPHGLKMTVNTDVNLVVAAAGAGAITELNLLGSTDHQ